MQFSLRNLMLAIAVLAVCITLVGRVTKNGSVLVRTHNDRYFIEAVLAEHGIHSYEVNSSGGGVRISFPKSFTLTSVDDAIVKDALERGYYVDIQYNAILPPFSSHRIMNAEISYIGDR